MPMISPHKSHNDWCHICGRRSGNNADVWYPNNAEHATKAEHQAQIGKNIKYIRICDWCSLSINEAAKKEI